LWDGTDTAPSAPTPPGQRDKRGSRPNQKNFRKSCPNRPDLSPAFRAIFQWSYGRCIALQLSELRAGSTRLPVNGQL